MKHLLFCIVFISSTCYGADVEELALQYASSFSEKDFKAAAEMVHCGEDYSADQIEEKHIGLEKELRFLAKEFGPVTKYKVSNENLYVAATLGCAPHEYLKLHLPKARKVVIEVLYGDKEPGYIVVGFINRSGALVPITVDHGIPMAGPSSAIRIMNVYRKLTAL